MFAVKGLDHIVLRTADAARLIAFYRDVLGCAVERSREDLGLWHLRAGAALIDIVDAAGPLGRPGGAAPGPEGRNLDHLCLRLQPFDEAAVRAHLAAHGIDALAAVPRFGAEGDGPSVYIADPDGNTVELKGPPFGGQGPGS